MSSSGTWQTTARNSSGPLGEGGAHEQAAVAAAHDGQAVRRDVTACDSGTPPAAMKSSNTFCLLAEHARAVPVLAVFAAPAQVGHRVEAARLEEEQQRPRPNAGRVAHVEPAVAGEQGGARAVVGAVRSRATRNIETRRAVPRGVAHEPDA